MDLGTLLRIILRRWIVVVPILAATIVVAYQVARTVEPEYQAKGAVWFIESPNLGELEANPLSTLNRGTNVTAEAIAIVIQNPDSREKIRDQGLTARYTVVPRSDRPIIDLQTQGESADQALGTLQGVIDIISETLVERQDALGVAPAQFIEIEVLLQDTRAKALNSARDRSVAVIIVLGVLAAATAAVLLDSYLRRRREDAASSGATTTSSVADDAEEEPATGDRDDGDRSAEAAPHGDDVPVMAATPAASATAPPPPAPVGVGTSNGGPSNGAAGQSSDPTSVEADEPVDDAADEPLPVTPAGSPAGDDGRQRRWFSRS